MHNRRGGRLVSAPAPSRGVRENARPSTGYVGRVGVGGSADRGDCHNRRALPDLTTARPLSFILPHKGGGILQPCSEPHAAFQAHPRIRRRAVCRLAAPGERHVGAAGARGRRLRHDRRAGERAWSGAHRRRRPCDGPGRPCRSFARLDALSARRRLERPARSPSRRRREGRARGRRISTPATAPAPGTMSTGSSIAARR